MTKNDLDALVASIVPAGHWDTFEPAADWKGRRFSEFVVAVLLPGLKRRPHVLRRLRRALRRSIPVGCFGRLYLQSRPGAHPRESWIRISGAVR